MLSLSNMLAYAQFAIYSDVIIVSSRKRYYETKKKIYLKLQLKVELLQKNPRTRSTPALTSFEAVDLQNTFSGIIWSLFSRITKLET